MDPAAGSAETVLAEALIIVALVSVGAVVVAVALMRAANRSAAVLVTVALTWLTLAALGAWAFTREPEALTVAATGVGAIAGAVSAVYRSDAPPPADRDRREPPA